MHPFIAGGARDHTEIFRLLVVTFEADRTVLGLFPQSEMQETKNETSVHFIRHRPMLHVFIILFTSLMELQPRKDAVKPIMECGAPYKKKCVQLTSSLVAINRKSSGGGKALPSQVKS